MQYYIISPLFLHHPSNKQKPELQRTDSLADPAYLITAVLLRHDDVQDEEANPVPVLPELLQLGN